MRQKKKIEQEKIVIIQQQIMTSPPPSWCGNNIVFLCLLSMRGHTRASWCAAPAGHRCEIQDRPHHALPTRLVGAITTAWPVSYQIITHDLVSILLMNTKHAINNIRIILAC